MVAGSRSATTLTIPSDREIVVMRVFEACTEPEHDGQTTLYAHLLDQSVEDRDGHLQSGMEAGMRQTLDRLAEHLRTMS